MRRIILGSLVVILGAAFLLCGCGYGRTAKRNNDLMLSLNIGQTKQEVLKVMGTPDKNESYFMQGKQIDVLFYRTDPDILDWGLDSSLTPMVFEDGKLTGWGTDFYQRNVELQYQIRQ